MKGPGRNAPCPCGSGRKYKHCCIRGEGPEPDVATDPMAWRRWRGTRAMRELRRLVDKEQWAEAEAVCERIRTDFPGEPVFELALATVRVAQGRYAEVAELSEEAALGCLRQDGEANVDLALDLVAKAGEYRRRAQCAEGALASREPFPLVRADPDLWRPAVSVRTSGPGPEPPI